MATREERSILKYLKAEARLLKASAHESLDDHHQDTAGKLMFAADTLLGCVERIEGGYHKSEEE